MYLTRRPVLTLIAALVIGWVVWQPVRALLFGGRVFSMGAAGEWVGTMEVVYPVQPAIEKPPARRAVIHFKLGVTDSFMDEYGGPGELMIAGQPKAIQLRIGAFRVDPHSTRVETAFISPGFQDTTLHECIFTGDKITLFSDESQGANFTANLHRGTIEEYQRLVSALR
jgi:hypothetical protein